MILNETRGRHNWKFGRYPVSIGTQKFLAGTRYPSVLFFSCPYPLPIGTKKFFLAGTRYLSVPKFFSGRYPVPIGTQNFFSGWYQVPIGTHKNFSGRYPTSGIYSVPGTKRYPTFLNFDGYRGTTHAYPCMKQLKYFKVL